MSYEFLEHKADVKFRARGSTLEEMFVFSAEALWETIRGDIKILEQESRNLEIEGKDIMGLLHNFLEEFLFLLDAEDFLVSRIEGVKIEAPSDDGLFRLSAIIFGDSANNYKFTNDVKAITYSEMFVREEDNEFFCQVVLDV
jgi:SHS2 domain-containing protein